MNQSHDRLLDGSRVHPHDSDPKLNRRQARKVLGRIGLASIVTLGAGIGVATFKGGGETAPKTTTVETGQTLSGIAEHELQSSGKKDPSTQQINQEVDRIVDANSDHLHGNTAQAGKEIKLP